MLEDDEYATALAGELDELKKKLASLRKERDEGKLTVRQLRTEQIFLKKQKERREQYRDLNLQKNLLQKQLEEKKQQKQDALQQLVDAKEKLEKLKFPDAEDLKSSSPNVKQQSERDISEITFQNSTDDTSIDAEETRKKCNY